MIKVDNTIQNAVSDLTTVETDKKLIAIVNLNLVKTESQSETLQYFIQLKYKKSETEAEKIKRLYKIVKAIIV